MADLFAEERRELETPPISGLTYRPDYLAEREERDLAAAIDAEPWDESWDRRRQPYGASYGKQQGERRPIPPWGLALAERLRADGIGERPFDQLLVNEYAPGQGISFHRDYDPFDRTVVSISLLASCVMDFRRVADGRRASMLLEPRSLLVLTDAARYEWEHGIARRKNDRWDGAVIPRRRRLSVTFRRLKR